MAKAAAHLGVSQPAVSEVIADLEHVLGVRLLDRSPHGVEATTYGRALLKRGTVAFDELKQGIREIEFLADPTVGEVWIGCSESVASAILPPIIQKFSQQYPGIVLHVKVVVSPSLELPELHERSLDLFLGRPGRMRPTEHKDLEVEILFDDHLVIAAGTQNPLTRRRKIDLAELAGEPWILSPLGSRNYVLLEEAFRARGLDMPKTSLMTFSVHLRTNLLANGPFIASFPYSVLRFNLDRFPLKALSVDLPTWPWPVAAVTLKNRTLSPVVRLFIDHIRACTRAMNAEKTR
jgi:DNA-binding transcriptional LysR family regulator